MGSERGEHAALDHQHLRVGDRLGRQGVLVGEFEPENVARKVKSSDLAATVAQNLVGSHRAADHLVKGLGRLVLAVNFRIVRIELGGTHEKNRLPEWLTLARAVKHFGRGRRDVSCGWDWAVECVTADCGLSEHGALPPGVSRSIDKLLAAGEQLR